MPSCIAKQQHTDFLFSDAKFDQESSDPLSTAAT